jgi:uncharacterized protein with GYD domain
MPTYIVLGHFTEQGVKNVKESPKRAEAFMQNAAKAGVNVKALYWTIGQYDVVVVVDAPDDETVTAGLLNLAALGNIRTQTLRAFDVKEMAQVIAKM